MDSLKEQLETELNSVFTVVAARGKEDGGVSLLFTFLHDSPMLLSEWSTKLLTEIATDPLVSDILGPNFYVTYIEHAPTRRVIIATNDVMEHAVPVMENPLLSTKEHLSVLCKDGEISSIDLAKTYLNCTKPHRIIVGCSECSQQELRMEDCIIRHTGDKAWTDVWNSDLYTAEKARKILKNRKTKIAYFTFISPKFTQDDAFGPYYRDLVDHDFMQVYPQMLKQKRKDMEPKRYRRYEKEVCTVCAMAKYCGRPKECPGPYKATEKELVEECLKKFPQSRQRFTYKQILFLLYNSGALPRTFQRKKCWATLAYTRDKPGMRFILRRISNCSDVHDLGDTFDEIVDNMEKLGIAKEVPTEMPKLERREMAYLHELLCYKNSPTRHGRWHPTQYNVLGITFDWGYWGGRLHLNFSTNTWRDWAKDGWICPWTVNPKSYMDLWDDTGKVFHVEQSYDHPLSFQQFHEKIS